MFILYICCCYLSFGVIQIRNKIKSLASPITIAFCSFFWKFCIFRFYSLDLIHFTHDGKCSSSHVEYPVSQHQVLKNKPSPTCILGSIVQDPLPMSAQVYFQVLCYLILICLYLLYRYYTA